MQKIGIIGSTSNDEVQLLKDRFEKFNSSVEIFDFTNFPEEFDLDISNDRFIVNLTDLNELSGLYVNSIMLKGFPFKKISEDAWLDKYKSYLLYHLTEQEKTSFKYALINYLMTKGKLVVNPPITFEFHSMKIYEYFLLNDSGIRVPD